MHAEGTSHSGKGLGYQKSNWFRLSPALVIKGLFLSCGDAHFTDGNVFDKIQTRRWVLS